MHDTVDIILPTHRRPHTIAYAIQSVLQQTHADFRLHVIGDGCDEATEAVVRSVGDPRVLFRRFAKGAGYGYANRNTVLRETDGEFVAYLCDDDLWCPDHLERGIAESYHYEDPDHYRLPADTREIPYDWSGAKRPSGRPRRLLTPRVS